MKILIISDVHGNLPSLEFVLEQEFDADLIISLGDVVNYGPWSNECVDLLESLQNKILIKGNHEDAFIKGIYPGSNPVSKAFFDFCYPEFHNKEKISKYIEDFTYLDYFFIHTLNDAYIFPDTELNLKQNTFIGHSHRIFERQIDNYKLVNVGSVGQNRVNIEDLNYVIWYPEKEKIDLITKKFSSDSLIKEMKSQKYPEICINYILSKHDKTT